MTTATQPETSPGATDTRAGEPEGLERLTGYSRSLRSSEGGGKVPGAARRGRPRLVTAYAKDQALLNTPAKRWWTLAALVVALLVPFYVTRDLTLLLSMAMVFAISGIGLNLLTGYAGQISLGHPFFMALGAYTAAVLGGTPGSSVWGLELDLAIALPMAALVPAVVGLVVAPLAVRVRGLYPRCSPSASSCSASRCSSSGRRSRVARESVAGPLSRSSSAVTCRFGMRWAPSSSTATSPTT